MQTKSILISKGINPKEPFLYVTKYEALERLIDFFEDWETDFPGKNAVSIFTKITKDELEVVFNAFASSIIDFHPENYHQERGAILRSWKIFEKYGFDRCDYDYVDFI